MKGTVMREADSDEMEEQQKSVSQHGVDGEED